MTTKAADVREFVALQFGSYFKVLKVEKLHYTWGQKTFSKNSGNNLADYMASHSRKRNSSWVLTFVLSSKIKNWSVLSSHTRCNCNYETRHLPGFRKFIVQSLAEASFCRLSWHFSHLRWHAISLYLIPSTLVFRTVITQHFPTAHFLLLWHSSNYSRRHSQKYRGVTQHFCCLCTYTVCCLGWYTLTSLYFSRSPIRWP